MASLHPKLQLRTPTNSPPKDGQKARDSQLGLHILP